MSIRLMKALTLTLSVMLTLAACDDATVVDPEPSATDLAPTESRAPQARHPFQLAPSNAQLGSLYALQGAFHGALNSSDEEALAALWAPDAVVWAGAIGCLPCTGRDAIVSAFSTSGPFVNGWASLAPSYKTSFEIQGNTAEYQFECVYLTDVGPGQSLAGPVRAHLNATGTMRRVGDRWLFQTFQAGAGSL